MKKTYLTPNFRYTFRHVKEKDLPLVRSWLVQPHVAEWFYGQGLENTFRSLDEFIQGSLESQYWLACDINHPIAFFITSFISKPHDEIASYCSEDGAAITLDMLIGDTNYLGKGLSDTLIREFLVSRFSDITEVLIDPEATNFRAVHVYEKVGFRILEEFIPSHSPNPHYMMKLNMKALTEGLKDEITIRSYQSNDVQDLANIYYNTIHKVNIQHYSQKQVDAWAPEASLQTQGWSKKFGKTKPIVAVVGNLIVGFAEFEINGHIDCFYCHHEWIGRGVGSALMNYIHQRARKEGISPIFAEVSITAKPFFEKQGFITVAEQSIERSGVKLTNYKMEKNIEGAI